MNLSPQSMVCAALTASLVLSGIAIAKDTPDVSRAAAERTALASVPAGTIKSAELERERNALVWSFDIAKPRTRTITEVLVDAKTGKILHIEHETPAQQRAEAAADAKAKRKPR